MNAKAEKFIKLLKEIFEVDKSDLDFGIYRIMNHKRDVINKFLEEDLINEIKKEIKNMDGNKEFIEEKVYTHLVNFFSRYYEEGDFISQRRYKEGIYAIPYQGEEVKLHWANYDQYYIKSTENFKDYSFKAGDKTIHFKIIEAVTELNNNKSLNDSKFFVLADDLDFINIKGNDLTIKFLFKSLPKSNKQDKLNIESLDKITKKLIETPELQEFLVYLQQIVPTEKNKKRTLLEKELSTYTSKNSFDYFIHKDLGGFLRRELDFYIKNEILNIDDISIENGKSLISQLDQIKIVKNSGNKIITFLEQIENFQKKLWLKKKFVVETNYCITLDRIESKFYSEILDNKEQIKHWRDLFVIEGNIDEEFLEVNKYLLLDTKFFGDEFKERLLATFDNIDKEIDGVLMHSDNFQALNLLGKKYNNEIKSIYIDPPYNAKSSEILYKNTYKHSSWLSLMNDRLLAAKKLLSQNGVLTVAIDENEQQKLGLLIDNIYPEYKKDLIAVVHNPSGKQGENFSYTHEYSYFVYPQGGRYIGMQQRDEGESDIRNFRDVTGDESLRTAAANCFYPIYIKGDKVIGFGDVCDDNYHPQSVNINRENGIIEVYPIDPQGIERKWRFARQSVEAIKDELIVNYISKRNVWDIQRVKNKFNFKTCWSESKYSANNYGTQVLNNIMGKEVFSYPKSINTVQDSLIAATNEEKNCTILDFFGGSGTTAHATINLNREDNGNRKYILIEMGEYFYSATKPRIERVVYSKSWKNGKPVDRVGISHIFKYLELEQYEDSLNNIEFFYNEQINLLHENIKEEYTVNYMLDFESKNSNTLLNIDKLKNPFEYKLKIERNGETQYRNIDLVETFNYLLGLKVEEMSKKESYSYDGVELDRYFNGIFIFKRIEGKLNDGSKVLIVWRTLSDDVKTYNDALNEYFKVKKIDTNEFDYIYINGDNTLEIDGRDNYKIKLIDEEFKRLMFEDIE